MRTGNWASAMTVTVPEGEYNGLCVERFEVPKSSLEGLRLEMEGRPCPPGTYTRLVDRQEYVDALGVTRRRGRLWMSDTPAEKSDHIGAYMQIALPGTRRVLLNGLGLGMILTAALSFDHVEHIDVVENDPRVINLVGPHYQKDPRVEIVDADAYVMAKHWPVGTRWDVGWSDIWDAPSTDDLADMARLRRSYARRCDWHDCWGRHQLLADRARTGAWR